MKLKNLFKYSVATAAIGLLSVNQSMAQFSMAIGPKGGVAITSFSGNDAGAVRAKTSGLGGLFVAAAFSEIFVLQPEFLISQRGATQINNNIESNISLTYFDVPVLAKLRLPIDKVFYPHILLGPDFAFGTNTKVSARDTRDGSQIALSGGQFNKTDIGALVGAGIDFQSEKVFVTLDARYGYSFSNVGTSGNGVALNYRNAGWSFTAGVGIRLFVDAEE